MINLISKLKLAAFGNTYVETVNPSQADTLHRYIKWSDESQFKKQFEICVRNVLKQMKLNRIKVAFDVTEDPYWGKKGFVNTRKRVHEKSDESWQFLTLSIVEPRFIPLMSLTYKRLDNLDDLVIDLLEYLKTLPLKVDLVLFDRGFYHWNLIDYLEGQKRGYSWPYLMLVPKTEKVKKFIIQTEERIKVFDHKGKYQLKGSSWKPETKIVILKGATKNKKGEPIDWCFATNQKSTFGLIHTYMKRWNIETGFRIHDEAQIKSKSSNPLIRYFYHLLSMFYILIWRLKQQKPNFKTVFKRFLLGFESKHNSIEWPS